MNKKTKKKKGKNKDEELISTKEVGIYDDFLIIEKDEKKDVHKNEDKKEDKKEEDQKEEKKSKKDFNINEFFFLKTGLLLN